MTHSATDIAFMRRALQLAANGRGFVSPNPMVGAVIVGPDGTIIGEGWHRAYGGPHAEVQAVASVPDHRRHLLPDSTIYVTLEPCSHYGKTPPCAKLLVECAFRRVVVGAGDPNPRVSGRGIAMLRDAGIEVTEGVLADECRRINRRFMTAHTLHRPFITLKWAQSADGYLDGQFSTPASATEVHALRAVHDAIAVGARTVLTDNPRLDTRLVAGHSPRPVVFDRHRIAASAPLLSAPRGTIYIDTDAPLADTLHNLYSDHGITSLLVEGGASLLATFIEAGLWDEARIEVALSNLAPHASVKAPSLPALPASTLTIGQNRIYNFES